MARANKSEKDVKKALTCLGMNASVSEVRRYLRDRSGDDAPSRSQIAVAIKKLSKEVKKKMNAVSGSMVKARNAAKKRSAGSRESGTANARPPMKFRLGLRALEEAERFISDTEQAERQAAYAARKTKKAQKTQNTPKKVVQARKGPAPRRDGRGSSSRRQRSAKEASRRCGRRV